MIYALFVVTALLSVCLIETVAARKGVIDFGEKIKLYKPCDDRKIVPFKGKFLILITIICFVCTLAAQIFLYKNTDIINFVKLYGLLLTAFSAGIIDAKRRIIPNQLIIVGLVFRAVIYAYEIFTSAETIKAVLINDLIGFAIGFVFLALVSFATKGALGFGDAKLFGIIGITGGAFCTYSTLLISLVISAVISIVNLARKKMSRKDSLPFGPCITAGYILTLFMSGY